MEKVAVGLDQLQEKYNVRDLVLGQEESNLQYISEETGALVALRGYNSGYRERNTGQEAPEPMHIIIVHPNRDALQKATQLSIDLVNSIRQECLSLMSSNSAGVGGGTFEWSCNIPQSHSYQDPRIQSASINKTFTSEANDNAPLLEVIQKLQHYIQENNISTPASSSYSTKNTSITQIDRTRCMGDFDDDRMQRSTTSVAIRTSRWDDKFPRIHDNNDQATTRDIDMTESRSRLGSSNVYRPYQEEISEFSASTLIPNCNQSAKDNFKQYSALKQTSSYAVDENDFTFDKLEYPTSIQAFRDNNLHATKNNNNLTEVDGNEKTDKRKKQSFGDNLVKSRAIQRHNYGKNNFKSFKVFLNKNKHDPNIVFAGIKVAIIPKDYPNIKLLEFEQMEWIRAFLTEKIDNFKPGRQKPKLESVYLSHGAVVIVCGNKYSAEWLRGTISSLSMPNKDNTRKIKLRPSGVLELQGFTKFKVYVPGPPVSNETMLKRMAKQNIGLNTKGWRIYDRQENKRKGVQFILSVDPESFEALRKYDFKPVCGTAQILTEIYRKPRKKIGFVAGRQRRLRAINKKLKRDCHKVKKIKSEEGSVKNWENKDKESDDSDQFGNEDENEGRNNPLSDSDEDESADDQNIGDRYTRNCEENYEYGLSSSGNVQCGNFGSVSSNTNQPLSTSRDNSEYFRAARKNDTVSWENSQRIINDQKDNSDCVEERVDKTNYWKYRGELQDNLRFRESMRDCEDDLKYRENKAGWGGSDQRGTKGYLMNDR